MNRASGVLLPISALPSRYYIGSFGKAAERFATLLQDAGQTYWQILPLSYPDQYHSPYASLATKAGDPLLISLELLCKEGLLKPTDLPDLPEGEIVEFEKAEILKNKLLHQAFQAFKCDDEYQKFLSANPWVQEFAIFLTLQNTYHSPWSKWPEEYRSHKKEALQLFTAQHQAEIDYQCFVQHIFYQQFRAFLQMLKKRKIKLIGDVPMYVAYDSFDVWSNPQAFELDAQLVPLAVAGVGPDYFSKEGQYWGHPLYNYEKERLANYPFWHDRMHFYATYFDVLRLDHFRAFDSYYAIPYGAPNALSGSWRKGEGIALVNAIKQAAPKVSFIGEDLGDIPTSVGTLLKTAGIPGMKVLQFAFDGNPKNPFLPENYTTNCVAYLGTHDNDTSYHWFESLDEDLQRKISDFCGAHSIVSLVPSLMLVIAGSPADLVIFTMQDVANNPLSKRINTPGTTTDNWNYMLSWDDCDLTYLTLITAATGRGANYGI